MIPILMKYEYEQKYSNLFSGVGIQQHAKKIDYLSLTWTSNPRS